MFRLSVRILRMNNKIKILAIETSCDETAASVVGVENKEPKVLSNVVSSQIDLHAKTGGVVPEVASRAHMEAIIPVIEEALRQAKLSQKPKVKSQKYKEEDLLKEITHFAVTAGPGLIGSLLVGFNTAKALAYGLDLPLIPINHIEGHIYSAMPARVESQKSVKSKVPGVEFPNLALTVSGGHTSLTLVGEHLKYKTLGQTIDDAAGEAFDKVAKLLDLGYPGGPEVSKLASKFRNRIKEKEVRSKDSQSHTSHCSLLTPIQFPRPLISKPNFDFSFSGLKTAVLTEVLRLKANSSNPTVS